MRQVVIGAVALGLAPLAALAEATPEQLARINETLAAGQCEVVEDDGGLDLDDVVCATGQYDIRLDAGFAVAEERKE
jgi:hypothetical protein